jgi:hypothetical protein
MMSVVEMSIKCQSTKCRITKYHFRKKKSGRGAKKSTPAKGKKGKKNQSEEEGEIGSDDDKEFDDGLDEDLIGEFFFYYTHRDKTRVQMPAKMFPHLKLIC